jgi:hypothetical protein
MVIVYVWIPADGSAPGHTSLEADNTYITYWPCEDGIYGKKNEKGIKTDGFAYSDSYEEDCDEIGRKAEYVIKIQSMPTSLIKKYWDEIDSSSYDLFFYNCSTVVANALLEGFDEYLELRRFNQFQKLTKWTQIVGPEIAARVIVLRLLPFPLNLLNTLLRIEYTIKWRHWFSVIVRLKP